MWKRFVVAAALIAGSLHAQEPTQEDFAAASAMSKALFAGRYLAADTAIRTKAFTAEGKPKPGFVYDQWSELQGLLNNEPAPPANDATMGDPVQTAADIRTLSTATPRDAIATIVARAKATRLVILNEDHASPRDRAFALQVARALRPLGYDVLGIETLLNVADDAASARAMAALARRGYPTRDTGTYLRDPVFADFLRQSLALGYRPVSYEATDFTQTGDVATRIPRREQAQAEYLVTRVLKARPAAKVLLYVGFDHATEFPKMRDGKPTRWLATRLKAMTGIDPLTIDQTTINAYGAGNTRLFAAVADRIGDRPAILFTGAKPLVTSRYAGLVDLQVAHPRTRRIGGRPDWLVTMGRTPTAIPPDLLPRTGRRLVQAFIAGETDAIPVDQVVVTAGQTPPMLMLPRAPIRYAVEDPPTG